MDWYRAKSIMIVFLICTNLFLGGYLVLDSRRTDSIDNDVRNAILLLLDEKGISIDAGLLAENGGTPEYAEAENIIGDYEEFAAQLLGSGYTAGADSTYIGRDGASVTFDGDNFTYYGKAAAPEGGLDDAYALNTAEEFMAAAGIDAPDGLTAADTADGRKSVTAVSTADGLDIFNSQLSVTVGSDGSICAAGRWYTETTAENGSEGRLSTVDIYTALARFTSDFDVENTEIVSARQGYTVADDNVYHETAVLTPVWCIELADGRSCYIDSRIIE